VDCGAGPRTGLSASGLCSDRPAENGFPILLEYEKISLGGTMKKIIVLLLLALAAVSCQKKEEPKQQLQFPTGPVQTGPMHDETAMLRDVVKNDPKNVEAWIKLGNALMDTRRFSEAIDPYQKALDLDPKNVDVRVDMGTCYRNSGKPDIAVKEYRKAIEMNPKHPNAHRNLGVVLEELGDPAGAAKEFETYLQLAPNAPDAATIRSIVGRLKASK
jgi:cytochrome c-type biogenesis protein CcmH/NrfG